ncbi:type IV toxin-antitoxin system AbiEi family antitoxin domain-containing protein [Gordonia jinhuaensis]|uniref:Very-short-patch-repair endonuclease n=1 Tax=Gordonia jinhuaensis TaxID=1517702 RepID=A0A916SYN6_9ACTN|nr:type IV toxin-antitoxin system AbiEi family antitoxin domain-containing protein [Gordonia jinhuaensis]GGB20457.1 hypothetical protein GCM10011489_05700 [Gordonia jinhuaensis]
MTPDIARLLAQHRGVCSVRQLTRAGANRSNIESLVRRGELDRLRHGWYRGRVFDPDVAAAVSAGGALTCVSALRTHGVWVPGSDRTVSGTVHVRTSSRGLDSPRMCRSFGRAPAVDAALDAPEVALRYAAKCLDAEGLIVVCDSLVNVGLMNLDEIRSALRAAPERIARLLDRCDRAESGTETMARVRLRSKRLVVRPQVTIAGVGRVDLLVGDSLVIEIDSRAHHTSSHDYEADRERDRKLIAMGYVVLRISYNQVVHDWPAVESAIDDLIRRRAHRRLPPAS